MNILLTGTTGYLATSFADHIKKYNFHKNPHSFDPVIAGLDTTTLLSLRDNTWQTTALTKYDTIIHTAALVHKNEKEVGPDPYFKVNTDLTLDLAAHAQKAGVKHFIFISTMSVYGKTEGIIDESTPLQPSTYYGQSKLLAEQKLQQLCQDTGMKLAIVRPPMIYGKNCPGNFARLKTLAQKTPIFPQLKNQRSMLYIENLCEFLRLAAKNTSEGIFCPQNAEYICTSTLVSEIASASGRKLRLLPGFAGILSHLSTHSPQIKKICGTLVYDQNCHNTIKNYNIVNFKQSIQQNVSK